MLIFVVLELGAYLFHHKAPLLLEEVVLLKARSHVSLVFLIVRCDLALPLLEYLDLETPLSRPLLSQVLVELFHRFVAELLTLTDHFLVIVFFLGDEPLRSFD